MKRGYILITVIAMISIIVAFVWINVPKLEPTKEQKSSSPILITEKGESYSQKSNIVSKIDPAPVQATSTPNSVTSSSQFTSAKLLGNKEMAKQVRWINQNAITVNFLEVQKTASKVTKQSFEPAPVTSREEAIVHLNNSVSMATRPSVGFEDKDFYYFSGGTRARRVTDFSTGFGIKKETGEIITW